MSLEHGAYYLRGRDRKRVPLGKDLAIALAEYAKLCGPRPRLRTIHDLVERYRLEILPFKRSAQTREDDGRSLERLDAVFGELLPDDLTAPHCYRYLDERKKVDQAGQLVPAPVAARHEISLLGHVLAKGIRWGACVTNVVRTLERLPKARRRRYVTDAEFIACRALASERLKLAMDLARTTGQRRGDLLALREEQLLEEGIVVRQGKTGAGVLIAWTPALEAIIDRARKMAPQIPRDYVLRNRRGRPYSRAGFSAMWQRLIARYVAKGGERFTFHDLRAKAGSDMPSIEEAAALLGHASTETTRRVYKRNLTRARPVE